MTQLNHPVPIYALVHPTEMNVATFQYSAFLNNPDKKLLHIGGWMRNIFSFYQLKVEDAFAVVTNHFQEDVPSSSHEDDAPPTRTFWTKYFGCSNTKTPKVVEVTTVTKKTQIQTAITQMIQEVPEACGGYPQYSEVERRNIIYP